ncbi:MAG: flavodoxin domain-containing protein [Gemmatimonadota bacterium]|nr:flavodoxin domain-containing protein [Gemmatimonadota bacterium]
MAPHRVLIVYGTSYGQTARIASRIHQLLAHQGFDVTVRKGDELGSALNPVSYDGVLVGASMIRHGYQQYMRAFVHRHASILNGMPSAFFAVSGSAGSANGAERDEAKRLADRFCRSAGWQPMMIESIAGAIAYTKYNWLLRWVMKRISAREGGSTDTSRDHEYTDWSQVERFAVGFGARVDEALALAAVR